MTGGPGDSPKEGMDGVEGTSALGIVISLPARHISILSSRSTDGIGLRPKRAGGDVVAAAPADSGTAFVAGKPAS